MSDFRPCRECKDWRTCLLTESEKEWFSYQDIRFCPLHVYFVLRYENVLRGHRWPVFDDTAPRGISSKPASEAAFVKASIVLAEIYNRLETTRDKGDILAAECKIPEKTKVQYLGGKARDALFYVAGDKRKNTSFTDWARMRRFRYEKRNRLKIAHSY
jgi:hypothetical protein